jgi:hypothetical protein
MWYNPLSWYSRSGTAPAPRPGGGMLAWAREVAGGWLGPRLSAGTPVARRLREEKVRSGPPNVVFPRIPPYIDETSGETDEHRNAYRLMMADPNVKAAVLGKLLGVAGLTLTVQPSRRDDPLAKEVADFTRWTLEEALSGGVPGLVWSVLSGALVDGYSVCEKVFEPESKGKYSDKWPLTQLKPKLPGTDLAPYTDDKLNVVGWMGLRYNAGQTFPPSLFVHFRHLPMYGSATGTSDLRAAYRAWWIIKVVSQLRAFGAENRALPLLLAEMQTADQEPALAAALSDAKARNWLIVPKDVRVTALNMAGSSDGAWAEFVKDQKHDIFLCIQGAMLQAVEGSVVSGRGNSQVHKQQSDLLTWHLSACIESLLNDRRDGLVRDIVDLNYVVDDYPLAKLSAVALTEMKAELDIDEGLKRLGLKLSKREMYERYGRTPPEGPEDELTPEGQGGGMPGMPPGPGGDQGGGMGALDAMLGGGDTGDGAEAFSEAHWLEAFEAFDEPRRVGEKWQGESGRWFTKKDDGHVVPTAAPGKASGPAKATGGGKPAKPPQPESAAVPADAKPKSDAGPFSTAGRASDPPNLSKPVSDPFGEAYGLKVFDNNVNYTMKEVFGDARPSQALLAAMANGYDPGEGKATRVSADRDGSKLKVTTRGPGLLAIRTFSRDKKGNVVCTNDLFKVEAGGPADGHGVALFLNQVRALRAAGVSHIATHAAGDFEQANEGGYCGYLVWPKFGYDGNMEEEAFERLPEPMQKAMGKKRNVQALLALPGGEAAWELHGSDIYKAKFDLKEGSKHMARLDAYLEKRRAKPDKVTRGDRAKEGTPEERMAKRRADLERKINDALASY